MGKIIIIQIAVISLIDLRHFQKYVGNLLEEYFVYYVMELLIVIGLYS